MPRNISSSSLIHSTLWRVSKPNSSLPGRHAGEESQASEEARAAERYQRAGVRVTLRFVEQRELGIDGSPGEGRQAQEILLQQRNVRLLVYGRHVLREGDEKKDASDLFQFTGKHLTKHTRTQSERNRLVWSVKHVVVPCLHLFLDQLLPFLRQHVDQVELRRHRPSERVDVPHIRLSEDKAQGRHVCLLSGDRKTSFCLLLPYCNG